MKNQGETAGQCRISEDSLCGAEGEFAETLRQKDMVWTALWKDKGAPMKQSPRCGENLSGKKTETHKQYGIRIG